MKNTTLPKMSKGLENEIKRSVEIKDQYPDEEILLFLHRHGILFGGHIIVLMVLVFIPILGFIIGPMIFPTIFAPPYAAIILFVTALYITFVWLYFFVAWVDYYLDAWIVTNKRILNIEQRGLFRRIISVQSLGNVQDVTSETFGVVRTFMNFGNVEVQTAGEAPRFLFEDVPNPDEVKNLIMNLSQKYKKDHYIETKIEGNINS